MRAIITSTRASDKNQPAVLEERKGEIEFRVVNNDGSRESFVILTGLKCIFQKQLPKMPKDYIARLVYDRAHLSFAIVKRPLEVVGYVEFGCRLHVWMLIGTVGSPIVLSRIASLRRLCFAPSPPTNKSRAMARISCLI